MTLRKKEALLRADAALPEAPDYAFSSEDPATNLFHTTAVTEILPTKRGRLQSEKSITAISSFASGLFFAAVAAVSYAPIFHPPSLSPDEPNTLSPAMMSHWLLIGTWLFFAAVATGSLVLGIGLLSRRQNGRD